MGKRSYVSVLLSLVVVLVAGVLPAYSRDGAKTYDRLLQQSEARFGAQGQQAVLEWVQMVDAARDLSESDKLFRVNLFFNSRVQFEDDLQIWGQDDYWATPLETLAQGRGDCEDFTIAKFVTLEALGVPAAKLRLIYVKANRATAGSERAQAHMVAGYFSTPSADPLILDNLVGDILPGSQRPDLIPVFSFNDAGLWAGGQLASNDPTMRLSRWRDLLRRLREEGFR